MGGPLADPFSGCPVALSARSDLQLRLFLHPESHGVTDTPLHVMQRQLQVCCRIGCEKHVCEAQQLKQGQRTLKGPEFVGAASTFELCCCSLWSGSSWCLPTSQSGPLLFQNGLVTGSPEMFKLKSCIRRKTDSIDKRFCFDIEVVERFGAFLFRGVSYLVRLFSDREKQPIASRISQPLESGAVCSFLYILWHIHAACCVKSDST